MAATRSSTDRVQSTAVPAAPGPRRGWRISTQRGGSDWARYSFTRVVSAVASSVASRKKRGSAIAQPSCRRSKVARSRRASIRSGSTTKISSPGAFRSHEFGSFMIVNVLLTLLWLSGAVYLVAMFRAARAKGQLSLNLESIGLGAVTNFFDTLGIGSFAPTTAYLKLRKMVPDSFIPSTLNAGHCIPTIVEALVFIKLVSVDPILLAACIVAATIGAVFGSAAVIRLPTQIVQGVVGAALVIASGLYALQNLDLMPGGGSALSLAPSWIGVAVAAHVVLGALMTFGIGLYAPSLIMLSLMGCESASNCDPSPFMVQVFGTVSEFAVFVESNPRPSVTPPFSSKQVAGQELALMPLGVTVRRRFTPAT